MSKKPINLNVKSGLAKLMAAENLTVIYNPKAKTASFDIVNRVLVLPMLPDMSGYVHDAFIAHEVSHALNTPYNEKQYEKLMGEIPHVFLNITEDARIEKLIKRKYPGTIRDFFQFYKRFSSDEQDFFGLKGKKLEDKTLIDRINLHFKIGSFRKIPFTQDERPFIDMVAAEATFDDAIFAAKAIYEHMKKQGTLKEIDEEDLPESSEGDNGDGGEQNGNQSGPDGMVVVKRKREKQGKNEDGTNTPANTPKESGEKRDSGDNPSGKSPMEQSESAGEESKGNVSAGETETKETDSEASEASPKNGSAVQPKSRSGDKESKDTKNDSSGDKTKDQDKVDSDSKDASDEKSKQKAVIPADAGSTQTNFDDSLQKQFIGNNPGTDERYFGDLARFDETWKHYVTEIHAPDSVDMNYYTQFLKTISPTINMMATYFNMKKSARDYQKTYIAKSGELNGDELSNYKTSEDIFLRNEVLHDSKNHGMVMMIDWSGSMEDNLKYTFKQLMVLMEFCKKTDIPFEVYGFTCGSHRGYGYIPKHKVSPDMGVEIFKMFSSNTSSSEFRKMCAHVYNNIVDAAQPRMSAIHSSGVTPINSMAVLTEYIINDFKRKFQREKTIFVMLSDGDETDSMAEGDTRIAKNGRGQIIMRDSTTGKNYVHDFKRDGSPFHTIFKYVKEKCNVTKMVGFYLTGSIPSNICQVVSPNRQGTVDITSLGRAFREAKYVEFGKDVGFDKYYVLSIANFDINMAEAEELDINPHSSDNTKKKRIEEFFLAKTKPLIFMRKFIEDIS